MGLIEKASPFWPLLNTPYTKENPVIRRIGCLPGRIVRADHYKADEICIPNFKKITTDKLLDDIRLMDATLMMYRRNGIAIPHYERAALVRYNGDPVLFTVVDEVHGKNIGRDEFTPEELKTVIPAVDGTYATLVQIADYVFFHGGSVLDDLAPDQFVWGSIADERNKIYYVDLEPNSHKVEKYQGEWATASSHFIHHYMKDYIEYIESLEQKMGAQMKSTRKELDLFYNQFSGTPYDYVANKTLDHLYRAKTTSS